MSQEVMDWYGTEFKTFDKSQCEMEVCYPRCVCENWKGHVAKHNYVN